MENLRKKIESLATRVEELSGQLKLDEKLAEIEDLEILVAQPGLWARPEEAKTKTERLAKLTTEVQDLQMLRVQAEDLKELLMLGEDLATEMEEQVKAIERELERLELLVRFTGEYDERDATLRITAGVGGVEAMDWAGMLERMYLRFFERAGMKARTLERVVGEEAGIKTTVFDVVGDKVYGKLRGEHGVHRLVRLSPFNADNLRQTSFALVEVLPKLEAEEDLVINEKDLRIDVYRSGGHGGQSVNTTDSAVRITHLPTGVVVAIQNERSQLQNRMKAMEILRGKLARMKLEQQVESIDSLRAGESAKWGQQIRNYVLQPYRLVKDTRTKHEETDTEAVLDGKIEGFIEAYLKSKVAGD